MICCLRVDTSVYPPVYLSILIIVYLYTPLTAHLSTCLPACPSTYLPVYISSYLLVYVIICLPVYLSTWFASFFVYQFISPPVHLSTRPLFYICSPVLLSSLVPFNMYTSCNFELNNLSTSYTFQTDFLAIFLFFYF